MSETGKKKRLIGLRIRIKKEDKIETDRVKALLMQEGRRKQVYKL